MTEGQKKQIFLVRRIKLIVPENLKICSFCPSVFLYPFPDRESNNLSLIFL